MTQDRAQRRRIRRTADANPHISHFDIDAAGRRCFCLRVNRRRGWPQCRRLMPLDRIRALQGGGILRDPDRHERRLGFRSILPHLAAPAPHQTPVYAVPERDIGNPRPRLEAFRQDPGLLPRRPTPSPRRSGDQLDAPIRATLMTVIKTRICHRHISALSSQRAEFP
jgi:hypothetical protein